MMRPSAIILGVFLTTAALVAACASDEQSVGLKKGTSRKQTDPQTGAPVPDYNDPHVTLKEGIPDPLEGLPRGAAQNDALCARAGALAEGNPSFNAVTNFLCKEKKPVASIKDLQNALGLNFTRVDQLGTNGSNGNPAFAFLAHSTSLVTRDVSAINPRAFVFSPPQGQPTRIQGFVAMTYTRGETFVEVAAEQAAPGPGVGKIGFYFIKFNLACEASNTCKNGDLLTPAVEKGWQGISVYDDEDLKNTLVDCRQCHQPDGPSTPMTLRMQELDDPWTHWFRSDRPGGLTLLEDYFRAHSDQEEYAGVPGTLIQKADGRALEDFVKGQGFVTQPNVFPSQQIEAQVKQSATSQPEINTPEGHSTIWDGLFQQSFIGQQIPVPYHDVKVTDPNKLQFASDEYKKFIAGQSSDMPDIRRVFLDSALEEMSLITKTGATGQEVLVQACAQCHNSKLDQSISRAKFDVGRLDTMNRAEKDLAIARLKLGSGDRLRMPPVTLRSLPDDARQAAIDYLSK